MSCGVPTIAARAGGVPEVVEDGVTGILGEVGDPEGMAAASLSLLEDRERYESFREAARKRAVDLFSTEKVVARYEQLYRELSGC